MANISAYTKVDRASLLFTQKYENVEQVRLNVNRV